MKIIHQTNQQSGLLVRTEVIHIVRQSHNAGAGGCSSLWQGAGISLASLGVFKVCVMFSLEVAIDKIA